MYFGIVILWSEFYQLDMIGIIVFCFIVFGFFIFVFCCIFVIFIMYKFMLNVIKNWKEVLFMGYFGFIGIGVVFYVEYIRYFYLKFVDVDEEMGNLLRVIGLMVYFFVFFFIVIYGFFIFVLNVIYGWYGVQLIQDDVMFFECKFICVLIFVNVEVGDDYMFIVYNCFLCFVFDDVELLIFDCIVFMGCRLMSCVLMGC